MEHEDKMIDSYSDYKKLTEEEKNLWNFDQLHSAGESARTAPERYAAKWVEKGSVTILTLIVIGVVGGLLRLVLI